MLFLGFQVVSFWLRKNEAASQLSAYQAQLSRSSQDFQSFKADLEYYLDPANLEKEIKDRFNYRSPGEKTIIIVPH